MQVDPAVDSAKIFELKVNARWPYSPVIPDLILDHSVRLIKTCELMVHSAGPMALWLEWKTLIHSGGMILKGLRPTMMPMIWEHMQISARISRPCSNTVLHSLPD